MKLVLFSDLHLDTQFAWLGSRDVARHRREALRRALQRIVELTEKEGADALLCGGDLYEHERFTPDTAAFLQHTFGALNPIRVFLAPGNHDWYGPGSLYRRVAWSNNVRIFSGARLEPFPLADGLTLWGAAHHAPAGTGDFLRGFRVDRGGVHVALFHASEASGLREQGSDKNPHAPFEAEELEQAGLDHAFLGHYHVPHDAERFTYPGNPEPLAFGETGTRGAVVIELGADGAVARRRVVVATTRLHDVQLDVTGCRSRGEVGERVSEALRGLNGIARVTLGGELGPDVELVPGDLNAMARSASGEGSVEAVLLRFGDLRPGYDLAAIRDEPTVRGQFVRDVFEAELGEDERRRVLVTGLRALDGRDDLEVP
jgi:hypothetical protein